MIVYLLPPVRLPDMDALLNRFDVVSVTIVNVILAEFSAHYISSLLLPAARR
jgi:hypothetical protein